MEEKIKVAAIIPAAGSGRRMGSAVNKIRLLLNGQLVLFHVLKAFSELGSGLDRLVLVVNEHELEFFSEFLQTEWPEFQGRVGLVIGGKERQNSVYHGLKSLEDWPGWEQPGRRLVIIHDAARAMLTLEMLEASIEAGKNYGAIGMAVPVKDTIKKADREGFVVETPERSTLWAIQTPQVFEFELLLSCYRTALQSGQDFSDDCSMVEFCGHRVKLVPGSYENIKITTPEDIVVAEEILRRRALANRTRV